MSSLILKHADAFRPSGEWRDDDYDVLADRIVVGRIMKAAAAPVGAPRLWTFGQHEGRTPTHGYAAPREAAMAAFAKKLAVGISGAGQAEQATRQRWPPPAPRLRRLLRCHPAG
jgi:hypothetical protein